MASERQIEANRKNAKRSSGPKTPWGKAKSRRNALFHGLSRSTADDWAVGALACAITKGAKQNEVEFEAGDIARVKLQLREIRTIRHRLLVALLESPDVKLVKRLRGLERYERAAIAMQNRGLRFRKP